MPRFAENIKWLDTANDNDVQEPEPHDVGYCSTCDVDIYLPRQPAGLCPSCEAQEVTQ